MEFVAVDLAGADIRFRVVDIHCESLEWDVNWRKRLRMGNGVILKK